MGTCKHGQDALRYSLRVFPAHPGYSREWSGAGRRVCEDKRSGTQAFVAGAEPSTLATVTVLRSSALVSTSCLRISWARVDEWRASDRSELWDRREQCKRIRMGAQAKGRAREALCPYGLFVSPTCGGLSNFVHNPTEAQTICPRGCPLRLLLSIVRSLAHLPDSRQCPNRSLVVTLPEQPWHV